MKPCQQCGRECAGEAGRDVLVEFLDGSSGVFHLCRDCIAAMKEHCAKESMEVKR